MPAPLPVDWKAIAVLAANGETLERLSLQFGVKLSTLKNRSAREGWKRKGRVVQAQRVETATNAGQMKQGADNGLALVKDTVADYGKTTRLNLAHAVDKAAQAAGELEPREALAASRAIKETVGSASAIHGWNENAGGNQVSINLLIQ